MSLPSPSIGTLLGHYRILEQIGAGGMGIVYRAHDLQLDRDVAIKFLPPGTLKDTGARSRFRKEALALAHICDTLDDGNISIEQETGRKPLIVATSARHSGHRTSFAAVKEMLHREARPFLILFGTGWGLTEATLSQADYVLEPIEGRTEFNHLSVRSAAAIVLDRLLR